jgi:hypothetical protein
MGARNFLEEFWWWLVGVVKKNPPSVAGVLSIIGTSMLLLGGIFAIMVHAKNGYLPEVNLVDMTATFLAIALVGVFFIVLIALVSFYSVWPVVYFKPDLNTTWNRFIFVLPSLLTVLYFAVLLFLSYSPFPPEWFLPVVFGITFLCLLLRPFFTDATCMLPKMSRGRKAWSIIEDSWRLLLSGFILCACLFLAAQIISEMLSEQQDDLNQKFLFLNFITIWGVVNFVLINLIINRKIKARYAILSILGFPLFLSFLAGNLTMVPTMTFRLLGLGEIPVTLALKEDACSALAQQTDSDSIRCQQGMVKHVMLKSRIGGWFMIEPILEKKKNGDDLGNVQKLLIRKEDVKFWIRERKKNKDEAVADGGAGGVVEKGVSGEAPGESKTNNKNP